MFDRCVRNIEEIRFLFFSSKEVEIIETCEPEKRYAIFLTNLEAPEHIIISNQKKPNC